MNNQIDSSNNNTIKMPVGHLRKGMVVVELDRPWLESPFLLQGFEIKETSEIVKLQECCEYVYVHKSAGMQALPADESGAGKRKTTKKSLYQRPARTSKPKTKKLSNGVLAYLGSNKLLSTMKDRKAYPIREKAVEEHPKAQKAFQEAQQAVEHLMEQTRLGGALDEESAKDVVSSCVSSVLRNPSALLWMVKIKNLDNYTMEHCLNVAILAAAFGRHLRMDQASLIELSTGGLLHDLGKVKVPSEILNKPSRLTDEEYEIMKSHAIIGSRMLKKSDNPLDYAIDVALNHHERMDGEGYPFGEFAGDLSEYSRIISIVDAFDAMTSDRCYDKSRSTLDALKEIYAGRGTQFDEALALEFIQLMGPYPPGTIVELNNGCVGIVLTSKTKKRHLPEVSLILDRNKKKLPEPELVDLTDVEAKKLTNDWLIKKVYKDGDFGIRLADYPIRDNLSKLADASNEKVGEDA